MTLLRSTLQRDQSIDKHRALLKTVCFWLFVLSLIAILLLVDKFFMRDLFNLPLIQEGKTDYIGKSYYGWEMKGEWEFYYNQWIMTDNIAEPRLDGYLNPGDKWTELEIDGKKLAREGYASYRFVVTGYKGDCYVYSRAYGKVANNIYINGQLVSSNAPVVSKKPGASVVVEDGEMYYVNAYYKQDDAPMEIVIETGFTDNAGLKEVPAMWYSTIPYHGEVRNWWWFGGFRDECVTAVVITLVLFSVGISIAIYNKQHSFSLVYFLLALLGFFIFTPDGFPIICLLTYGNPQLLECMSFVMPCIVLVAMMYHLYQEGIIDEDKKTLLTYGGAFVALNVAQVLLYYFARGTYWQHLSVLIYTLSLLPLPYFLLKRAAKDSPIYIVLLALLLELFFINLCDISSTLSNSYTMVYAVGVLLVCLVVVAVFIQRAYRNERLLMEKMQIEKNLADMRRQALLTQIKPHFIFNSLVLIKDSYHLSQEDGDRAMGLFENHLLAYVKTGELVDVDAELHFVNNYFELEKLRNSKKIKVVYDLQKEGFKVPVLTIQPLVENAIKYSRIQDKADGMIIVRTYSDKDYIYIQVIDNGRGFDLDTTRANAAGINNVRERLRYYQQGQLTITSTIGVGTTATIKIPYNNTPKHE